MSDHAPPATPSRERSDGLLSRLPWTLCAIGLVVLTVDQISKSWVQNHFGACVYAPSQTVIPNWLSLTYACNNGAAFGIMANQTLLFVLIAVVVAGIVIAYARFLPTGRLLLKISLGLQLGGAIGNIVDRIRQGYVVDFIAVKSFPVFNLADSCIVVGVCLLACYLIFVPPGTTASSRMPRSRDGAS